MHIYELYINDTLCDLSGDSNITLLFQSPIFSELDSIQSNRSYEISLPLTGRNRAIFENCDRADIRGRMPYEKLPARLYMDGVMIFDSGFAVVTSINEGINITLTWGNVDNFQPLFDEKLSELDFGDDGLLEWNSKVEIPRGWSPNGVDFLRCVFYDTEKPFSDIRYVHPTITVERILQAIEERRGITIGNYDDSIRLKLFNGLPMVVPLASRNANIDSNRAEAIEGSLAMTSNYVLGDNFVDQGPHQVEAVIKFNTISSDPRGIRGTMGHKLLNLTGENKCNKLHFMMTGSDPMYPNTVILPSIDADPKQVRLCLVGDFFKWIRDDSYTPQEIDDMINEHLLAEFRPIAKMELGRMHFNNIIADIDVSGISEINLYYLHSGLNSIDQSSPLENVTIKAYGDWDTLAFPTIFPIAPNLPDMSQGEFINQLLKLQGLFAYPDTKEVDTIRLLSVDDIRNGDIVDWSSRIIVSHTDDMARPDTSVFSNDDFAQKNTLDYDNDEDVTFKTAGSFTINDKTLEKEKQLVELEFSASGNKHITETINGDDVEYDCAVVPIYTKKDNSNDVDFEEVTPRILVMDSAEGENGSNSRVFFAKFLPSMSFGGEDGIVATKYKSYAKILQDYHMITVPMKLSPLDLANFSFKNRIYLDSFGQTFALYSIETSDTDICEVKLIRLID